MKGVFNLPHEPKLRTVNKATPPYELNKFPKTFIELLGKELVYLMATKESYSLEGSEWENIFANCINAEWKPSNVGLDDVVLDNCCWGAKTVKASSKNILNQKSVRLISGRNSPAYSFDEDNILHQDPNYIGNLVLDIWNERVSAVRQIYKFVRTVVLVKSNDFTEFLIFETDTVRYDPELYFFKWNSRKNLEGFDKKNKRHCFTWQPHGSQFTIIEDIPEDYTAIRVKQPDRLDKNQVLDAVKYDKSWVTIIS